MNADNERSGKIEDPSNAGPPSFVGAMVDAFSSAFPYLSMAIMLKVFNMFAAATIDQTAPALLALLAMTIGALSDLLIIPALICAAVMALASILRSCWERWPIFS